MTASIRPFARADAEAVVALWREVGLTRPWNDPFRDIERKLTQQPELFVVAECEGEIFGTVMAGFEGHRGWMNYLAVSPAARGTGLGRRLVEHVEVALERVGCPKLSLQVRSSNAEVLKFYEHLGYGVDDVISMGKRLIAD